MSKRELDQDDKLVLYGCGTLGGMVAMILSLLLYLVWRR